MYLLMVILVLLVLQVRRYMEISTNYVMCRNYVHTKVRFMTISHVHQPMPRQGFLTLLFIAYY